MEVLKELKEKNVVSVNRKEKYILQLLLGNGRAYYFHHLDESDERLYVRTNNKEATRYPTKGSANACFDFLSSFKEKNFYILVDTDNSHDWHLTTKIVFCEVIATSDEEV